MPFFAALGAMLGVLARIYVVSRIVNIVTKVATRVILFGVVVGVFLGVLTAIENTITGLSSITPPSIVLVFSWFVPSNFYACVSAIATVQLLIWAWHWKKYAFDFLAGGVS